MFKDILVAVDGSRHAERALQEAIDLARSEHARLTVLVSVPDPWAWTGLSAETAAGMSALLPEIERRYQVILDAAVRKVPDDVPVTKVLLRGWPGSAIVRHMEEAGHDLVVLGSRGHGEFRSLLMGSVSQHVLHANPGAVLVVHSPED